MMDMEDFVDGLFSVCVWKQHPPFMTLSKTMGLLELENEFERRALLDLQVMFTNWSPRVGTSKSNMLYPGDRWVKIKGIPLHLWSWDKFDSLAAPFGLFVKVNSYGK